MSKFINKYIYINIRNILLYDRLMMHYLPCQCKIIIICLVIINLDFIKILLQILIDKK